MRSRSKSHIKAEVLEKLGADPLPIPAFDLRCPVCWRHLTAAWEHGKFLYYHDRSAHKCANEGKVYRVSTRLDIKEVN